MTASVGRDPDGRHGPHVFVADVEHPALDSGDHHHLARVLRLRPGDSCTVSDGAGRWAPAAFAETPTLLGPPVDVPAPVPPITIAFALVKGQRPELIVQKLTEIGVDRIVPMTTERSIVRWDDARATRHMDRLRVVAREAAMQCRRSWLPEVASVSTPVDVCRGGGVARAEPGGGAPSLTRPTILVGPEGGWSGAEGELCGHDVGLGPHVLRTETVAMVAGSLLVALRTGVITP